MDSDNTTGQKPPALQPTVPTQPPPATYPPRRRSSGWIVVVIVLLTVVGLGLGGLFLLATFASISLGPTTAVSGASALQEVVTKNEGSRHKIALLEISGIITSSPWDRSGYNLVDLIRDQLTLAGEDPRVRAVVLYIDSPGGEVLASDEIYQAIAEFQKDHNKPVVATMQSLAASGGYYTAVACEWIVAHELTLTGSIGVVLSGYNYRGLLDKVGVHPEVYKSGRFKDMLSGTKRQEDITPEERRMVQDLVDETFDRFKQVVRDGRTAALEANKNTGQTLDSEWEEYADGRILSGTQAYEHGFVDELGNLETAISRARKLSRIPDANIVRYLRPLDLSSLFRLFGQSEASTVKLDLGIDVSNPRLEAGRLYFLAPALMP